MRHSDFSTLYADRKMKTKSKRELHQEITKLRKRIRAQEALLRKAAVRAEEVMFVAHEAKRMLPNLAETVARKSQLRSELARIKST